MKSEPEYLSQPKLLRCAQELGLDLNERTLQYYVKRGLLPRGEKNPYSGADGRVAYWPGDVLKRVRRIFQLKQQGLKLEQIRLSLDEGARLPVAEPDGEDWRRQVAFRYLKHFLSGPVRAPLQDLGLQALREYLAANLTPLIGEEAAGQWVEQFFLELHPKELPRYLARFRAEQGSGPSWVTEIAATTRQVVTQFRLGRVKAEPYMAYLQAQQELFGRALQRVQTMNHPAAAGAVSALRELSVLVTELARAQDTKKSMSRYCQCLERLQVASQVETQWLWLESFQESQPGLRTLPEC